MNEPSIIIPGRSVRWDIRMRMRIKKRMAREEAATWKGKSLAVNGEVSAYRNILAGRGSLWE